MSGDIPTEPLRLSFTLPGSASLGAYQAGALSAVSEVIDELGSQGREVHVDAVGGASAGSIVSLMFVHCLLEGLDTAELLHRAWVDGVDVSTLRSGRRDSPLGFDELRDDLIDFLATDGGDERRSGEPVALHIGLTNLLGLSYPIETARSKAEGITFVDWADFVLDPGQGLRQLTEPEGRSPVDYVLASARHPGAFSPVALDRSANRSRYDDNGITNFPDSGTLWYTDGGLVEAEPIGRVLELARQQAGEAAGARLHLVIDPRSSGPSGSDDWQDPDADGSWLAGLRRALSILPTQALHDDLRGVAVANRRLTMIDDVVDALAPVIADHGEVVAELAAGLELPSSGDPDRNLRSALRALAGVSEKEQVDVEVISPLELTRDREEGVSQLLAGDVVGAFGGFLSRDIRASDFGLGWASTVAWVPGGLERHGVTASDIDSIRNRLESHRLADRRFDEPNGPMSPDLGVRARLRLAGLAARVGRILIEEALPDVPVPFERRRKQRDG